MVASQAFQALIDQLVSLHATELEALRAALSRKEESPVLSPTLVGMERMMTPMSVNSNLSYPGQWRNKRLSSQSALVDANTILEAWDEQEHQEMRDIQNQTRFSTSESDTPTRSERCQDFLVSATYEGFMAGVLVANMLWMAWTVQVQGGQINSLTDTFGVGMEIWREIFYLGDAIFAGLYIGDACLRILGLGRRFWRTWMNCLDFVVAAFCVVEIFWLLSADSSDVNFDFFRLMRIVKLTKVLRMFSVAVGHAPLQLLVKCLEASRGMLFWSFCLLSLLQLLVCQLGAGLSRARRQHLRVVRTLLPALPLRLRLRGAQCCKLSVCPADDENRHFRRRAGFQAEGEGHRSVQSESAEALSNHRLFWRRCDQLGGVRKAGAVTQAELLDEPIGVGVPRLVEPLRVPGQRRWPDHAEAEGVSTESMHLLATADCAGSTRHAEPRCAQLSEFIEGAGRLRGSAKALDIWRMETKIEVLFEEVFKILPQVWPSPQDEEEDEDVGQQGSGHCSVSSTPRKATSVQDVFNNSSFKHIRATSIRNADS
eukprot:s4493_g6.t1